MVIPEKMKHNRFRIVTIPKNRKYFERFGFSPSPSSAFSGDEVLPSGNKTDQLQQMMKKYEKEASE